MTAPATSTGLTLTRRSLLKGMGLAAVSVHVLGPSAALAATAEEQATLLESSTTTTVDAVSSLAALAGTLVGPPRGSRTNVIRYDTAGGPVWLAGGGRKLFLPEPGDDVVLGYVDPYLGHSASRHTTTLGAIEHEIRSHFGDGTYLEVVARIRARIV